MRLPIFPFVWLSCMVGLSAKPAGHLRMIPISDHLAIKLRWIPPGSFVMGSPENELGHAVNERQTFVRITKGFYLGETELTQAQWQTVIPENPSQFRGAALPVETITWADAKRFCEILNREQIRSGRLPKGYRWDLPTEAQWEYACRAGTVASLHHGIDLASLDKTCPNLNQVAWYQSNARGFTHPVGGKKANRWGLRDMHGNVWEWCRDRYVENVPGGNDPFVALGDKHVRRGGSAGYQARTCRAASRDGLLLNAKGNGLGLRLALVRDDSPH